jgi:hypothetical protein
MATENIMYKLRDFWGLVLYLVTESVEETNLQKEREG